MNTSKTIKEHFEKSIDVKQKTIETALPAIQMAFESMLQAIQNGGKILLCGNGGSAADAQHIAAELVVRLRSTFPRPALPALALTVDSSVMTAGGNDFGFDEIFARQVEALGMRHDTLIAISTSGNSQNILRAVEEAGKKGITTVGLLGGTGGKLADLVNVPVVVPAEETAHIQETHITIGHIWCRMLEERLFG